MIWGLYDNMEDDDGWISHYARKFIAIYPQYSNLFETRNRKNGYFSEESESDV